MAVNWMMAESASRLPASRVVRRTAWTKVVFRSNLDVDTFKFNKFGVDLRTLKHIISN